MATAKKPAAKSAAKKPGTSMMPWEKQMAEAAQKQASAQHVGGSFKAVSIRGGILSIDDNPVKGNQLRCVVLVDCPENQYYIGKFDPSKPQAPVCYAFGDLSATDPEDNMAPHEKAKDPQSEDCSTCPHNEFGSADTGRGKACKNVRRIALITEDALESPEAMEEAEVRMLKVPVMSVKNFGKYVQKLSEDVQRPTWGVITLLQVVPDAKSQFKLQFSFEELIVFKQPLYDALQSKLGSVSKDIVSPYPDLPEQEDKPARGKAAPARGKAAAKPAGKRKY